MPGARAAQPSLQSFADRLRDLRKAKRLSQTELGKLVDLHYTHIGRYERAISMPAADTLQRLAEALGVSADYLLEGNTDDAAKADFKDRELLRQFQEVERLSDDEKSVVKKLLEAFLMKKQLEKMIARAGEAT
jgi:transcriptional regulator with XRE-family HTH domain